MKIAFPRITAEQNVHDLGAMRLIPRCGHCDSVLTVIGSWFGHVFRGNCSQEEARFELITDQHTGCLQFVQVSMESQ